MMATNKKQNPVLIEFSDHDRYGEKYIVKDDDYINRVFEMLFYHQPIELGFKNIIN